MVCQIPNGTSCAHVEHRDHGGNDKAHVELRSLESSQDFEDRKSCLSTEQVSFESTLDNKCVPVVADLSFLQQQQLLVEMIIIHEIITVSTQIYIYV